MKTLLTISIDEAGVLHGAVAQHTSEVVSRHSNEIKWFTKTMEGRLLSGLSGPVSMTKKPAFEFGIE